jgi:DNA invertase Pin-like site-specific DNA recombinase
MDKIVGYIRVSTVDQAAYGAGMDAQKGSILRACEYRQLDLCEIVADDGYSAKTMKRPGLEKCLRMVRSGEVDGLMVTKLDRLSRSIADFSSIMAASQKEGWRLIVLEPDIDFSTPFGKLLANILASFAEFERDMISMRTREGMQEKKRQGVKFGPSTQIDPHVRDIIRARHACGMTYREIADELSRAGIPTPTGKAFWAHQTVYDLVKRDYQ